MNPALISFLAIIPALILIFSEERKESGRKKKALRLEQSIADLLSSYEDRPLNLFTTRSGNKLLPSSSILNHIEKMIVFMEGSNRASGFIFSKQFRPFEQRFSELEKRTTQLEHEKTRRTTG